MRSLPLYPETPLAYVEQWPPREVESGSCTRCSLHVQTEHSCHSADGEAGGLLVYGEGPTKEDDRAKRIFTGRSGDYVRRLVRQWYKGPVAFDNVIRCPTPPEVKGDKVKRDKAIAQAVAVCRQFSHQTIIETRPERVVVLGARAASGILGRSPLPLSVRDGYGWLWREGQPVPVFYLMHPVAALRNRYLQKWFEVDFKHALTRPIPERPPWHALARIIATSEDAQTAARQLSRAPWVALDCETFGRPYSAGFRVTSVAVCAADSDSPFVWPYEALQDQGCRDALQAVLDSTENVCQNGKFDSQALRQGLGVDMPPHKIDTRLVCKLLDPDAASALAVQAELVGMGGHKEENAGYLKTAKLELMRWARLQADEDATVDEMLADAWMRRARAEVKAKRDEARDLGEPLPSYKGLKAPEPTWMAKPDWFTPEVRKLLLDGLRAEVYTYALVPEDVSLRYNGLDAVSTARLGLRYEAILQSDKRAARVWNTALQPASRAIETIERLGIAAATSTMQALSAYLALRINDVRGRLAEYKFNPDSAVQVAKLLFEDLKLPVVSLTDAGAASTDKGTLNALKGQHPVVEELLDWRRLNKLKGTYADGMVLHVQDDGRIHTSLHLDGARSGRLSSSDPNLQNAPGAGTDEGKLFRDCFTAAPGMTLVEGDFSQLELRVAACLSGDDEMRRVFESGVDFHMQVAKFIAPIVWRIKPEDVTAEHRRTTKQFVFGVLYGMSDAGIVARTGCSFDEAGSIRAAVMGKFKVLDRWVKQTVRLAYQQGGAYTWWAGQQFRWRALPDLGEQDEGRGANAENASFNGPVQGCLPAHTRILTREGYLPIGDAPETGLAWTGSNWALYKKLDRGECELAELRFANGQTLECDTRHQVLVDRFGKYEFVSFADLQQGDMVCFTLPQPIEFGGNAERNDDDFYWLGFSLGNGCTSHGSGHKNALAITFGDRKGRYKRADKAAEYETWLRRHGVEPQARRVFENKITVVGEAAHLRNVMECCGYPWGMRAKDKRVPAAVWRGALNHRQSFLRGLLDADGTVGGPEGGVNLHMAALALLEEIMVLLRTVGVESVLRGPYGPVDAAWRLDINKTQAAQHLGYGTGSVVVSRVRAPLGCVEEFLARTPKSRLPMTVGTPSQRALYYRLRAGGSTSAHALTGMCAAFGVELSQPVYATSRLLAKRCLGVVERTYTLSVDSALHRFDSEGVISKNTANEFCLMSVVALIDWLEQTRFPANVVMTVHDSILCEVAPSRLDELVERMNTIMTGWPSNGVPLEVDFKTGPSWGSMEKIELPSKKLEQARKTA